MSHEFEQQPAILGSRLTARSLPLCPELKLWLLGDDIDLNQRIPELLQIERAPYWAFCWGSGQALARYLLDNPELVRGQRVADFGAGCGVAAIAALKSGAASSTAVDIDPNALRACQANARLNGVSVAAELALPAEYDVLLASDVLYELGNRELLQEAVARGRTVLVADPLRLGNAQLELTPSAHYAVKTVPDVDYPIGRAVIYRWDGLSDRSSPPAPPPRT